MARLGVAVVIYLLSAALAFGSETLVVTRAGYWLLSQDAAGVPSLRKIDHVIKIDEVPTDPNPPSEMTVHRAAVQAATASVSDPNKTNTKKALAELYRTVATLPVTSRDQLAQATDVMFGALNLPMWAPWKIAVDKSLAGFVALGDARPAWLVVAEVLSQ